MPGSAYYKIGKQVSDWLKVVPECNINTSSKIVADSLGDIELNEDEIIVSFDVSSLYTNVPVQEAIEHCTDLLFSGNHRKPPVDRETFQKLLTACTCDVIMSTSLGFYRQVDGLAMGSPPAPLLANGWLSQFDSLIQGEATIYHRYIDDIVREIKKTNVQKKLDDINKLHPSLKFTMEEENDCSIPFLDLKIIRTDRKLASTWYTKPTDTGLTMNFHALAPLKYKRSTVIGLVHRIHRSCSTWKHFHSSIEKAKIILSKNQYPASFYEPLIEKTITKIITEEKQKENETETEKELVKKVFIEYRGRESDKFEKALKRCQAPCRIIFKLRKTKTCLPSLKPSIEKPLKSWIVYHFECPRCDASYVGQCGRHLLTRFKEHKRSVVGRHFDQCGIELTMDHVSIIDQSFVSLEYLMTLEALWIEEIKPSLNTKDEYKSHQLVIKI